MFARRKSFPLSQCWALHSFQFDQSETEQLTSQVRTWQGWLVDGRWPWHLSADTGRETPESTMEMNMMQKFKDFNLMNFIILSGFLSSRTIWGQLLHDQLYHGWVGGKMYTSWDCPISTSRVNESCAPLKWPNTQINNAKIQTINCQACTNIFQTLHQIKLIFKKYFNIQLFFTCAVFV